MTSRQCLALVKDSKSHMLRQCKNRVESPEILCWQHRNKPGIQLVTDIPTGQTPKSQPQQTPTPTPVAVARPPSPTRPQSPVKQKPVAPIATGPAGPLMPFQPKPILAKPSPGKKSPGRVVFQEGSPQKRLIPNRQATPEAVKLTLSNLGFKALPVTDHTQEFPPFVTVDGQNYNIPKTETRESYLPVTRPLPSDDAYLQKIGGKNALLLEREEWPEGAHFIMQFVDPADKDFIRVFLTGVEEDVPKATLLRASLNDPREFISLVNRLELLKLAIVINEHRRLSVGISIEKSPITSLKAS